MLRISACCLLVIWTALPAVRASEMDGVHADSRLRDAVTECRLLTTAIARLDCYDAIELGEDAAVPEIASEDVDEEAFGFEFDVKDALQSVTTTVGNVRKNAKGGLVLTLANGQVWQQSDAQKLFLDEGDSVTITRGALSAFYLTRDGKGRRYKFSRVQ